MLTQRKLLENQVIFLDGFANTGRGKNLKERLTRDSTL